MRNVTADQSIDLGTDLGPPTYSDLVGWMRRLPEAELGGMALDIWARGNFTRRLVHHRNNGVRPVLLTASHASQMRWAYRRLALAGVPVDFIYTGPMPTPRWRVTWMPMDLEFSCGHGYFVAAASAVVDRLGDRWWPLGGLSSPMPEAVANWLIGEAGPGFEQGKVFAAPAPLVGLPSKRESSQHQALSDVAGGALATTEVDTACAVLDLEIPWIDGLQPVEFQKLLSDFGDDLEEFQSAFQGLVHGYSRSEDGAKFAHQRLEEAVACLLRSSRRQTFRLFIKDCGASLKTFPVAMGALAAAGAAFSGDPFAGAAVVAGAAKKLQETWQAARSSAGQTMSGSNRLLIKLGAEKGRSRRRLRRTRAIPPSDLGIFCQSGQLPEPHWLCRPASPAAIPLRKETTDAEPG